MRLHRRTLALLAGIALAAALVVLAPRIGGAVAAGGPGAAAAVRDAGGADEALHRTGGRTPDRALLLLAVLVAVGAAAALVAHPLVPGTRIVPSSPVPVVRAGVRGPPHPPRSAVR